MSFARTPPAGAVFEPLPIDPDRGVPQELVHRFDGATYRLRLHANLSAEELAEGHDFYDLPTASGGHLVVRVEREEPGGARTLLFQRKVVPGLAYEAGPVLLTFPDQRLARANVNGRGPAGSHLSGGIARRWA
jgi:hypothetical protein